MLCDVYFLRVVTYRGSLKLVLDGIVHIGLAVLTLPSSGSEWYYSLLCSLWGRTEGFARMRLIYSASLLQAVAWREKFLWLTFEPFSWAISEQ